MRHKHCRIWNMSRNNQKRGNWQIYNVGPGFWWENWKMLKNKTQTLFDIEYAEKHWKKLKMINSHCRTWSMARKLTSWKMRNTHCRTWNFARNTEKCEKWEMHIVGPGIRQENLKTWKMRIAHCRTWSTARKLKIMENEKHTP